MNIGIIGAGAWGTALAIYFSEIKNLNITLWTRSEEHLNELISLRENKKYLPGFKLNQNIKFTNDKNGVCNSDYLIITVPAQQIRELAKSFNFSNKKLIICSKGIENQTLKLMHEILAENSSNCEIAVISGPNLAHEVAKKLPTTCTIASQSSEFENFAKLVSSDILKFYYSNDIIGTEVFGALKNVLAIGAGILKSYNLGDNNFASFINQGIKELNLISLALGGKAETILTPAGIGDLVLTCISDKSRNNKFGAEIASGKTIDEIKSSSKLAEGYFTALSIYEFLNNNNLNLPLLFTIYKVLYKNEKPDIIRKSDWL